MPILYRSKVLLLFVAAPIVIMCVVYSITYVNVNLTSKTVSVMDTISHTARSLFSKIDLQTELLSNPTHSLLLSPDEAMDIDPSSNPAVLQAVLQAKNAFSHAIVLYAKQRTGSSFTSRFLASDPDITYLFEPLNHLQRPYIAKKGAQLLEEYLSCNFSRIMDHATARRTKWLKVIFCDFPELKKMTKDCGLTFTPKVWSRDCRKLPLIAAKIITLPRIAQLGEMLDQGLKVWALFRDPRGVVSSRKGIGNYKPGGPRNATILNDAEKYCSNGMEDIAWIRRRFNFITHAVDQILPIRYEDLASKPHEQVERL